MKLILLLLFLPIFAAAQQDFDYALYTRHSESALIRNKDSSLFPLLTERRIVKEGSKLTITPLMNTGNTRQFTIQFQGFDFGKAPLPNNRFFFGDAEIVSFHYATEDQKYYIKIWPTVPLVEFYILGTGGELYERFY